MLLPYSREGFKASFAYPGRRTGLFSLSAAMRIAFMSLAPGFLHGVEIMSCEFGLSRCDP